ncbi:NAD-dependent epimerase/dehydratase family protein [Nocardioides sp. Leaf374]|uniref:NAD-dependent epimerase/dehydratase family protein n=1 Tax=Nocardioides sp. Leaf374 TaxID=2876560 RepID=UPI001E4BB9C1|nr:NAD-dependent epimerase/dehydratase family protein [Nocardioides sp. Leaf374]
MRILVLGGSVFLSRAVAQEALERGHEVTCASRGRSGTVPEGAEHVEWDRSTRVVPPALASQRWDVVVDVARTPSWVRRSVTTWPEAHHVFVSTVNVYSDDASPGQTPSRGALRPAQHADVDPTTDPDAYGAMKVACEEIVLAGAARSLVLRPGLLIGPGDPSGRFTYWPARLAEAGDGEPVLAGGSPRDVVQVLDARDLATWVVTAAERRLTGAYDAVGPTTTAGELLAEVAAGVGVTPRLRWVASDRLEAAGVQAWSGPDSLPLWLPRPAYDGMLAHDATPSLAAGLVVRPVADSARDTLAWLRATPGAPTTGLTREAEAVVLAAG